MIAKAERAKKTIQVRGVGSVNLAETLRVEKKE